MSFFLHETRYRDLAPAAEKQITVCGAGALGANLAETLARMGFRKLRVVDRDRVEAHNLSSQPWSQQDIGAPKARVLANMLYRAVGARVEPQHVELTEANAVTLLRGSELVIDTFDNTAARAAVGVACLSLNVPCLHVALAASGDYGCGLWDAAYTFNQHPAPHESGTPPCNYPLTRPLALLVAAGGAEMAVRYLGNSEKRGFELTLRDMRLTAT